MNGHIYEKTDGQDCHSTKMVLVFAVHSTWFVGNRHHIAIQICLDGHPDINEVLEMHTGTKPIEVICIL